MDHAETRRREGAERGRVKRAGGCGEGWRGGSVMLPLCCGREVSRGRITLRRGDAKVQSEFE